MKRIFNPETIAVFGATNRKESIGYTVMKNIVSSGFEGIVYPINLKRRNVFGTKAYKSIKDTEDTIDLVVIATPTKTVVDIIEQCGKYGVGGIVIITSGFLESGKDGQKMLDKVKKLGKKYGVRIIGPNSFGFIRPLQKLNVSFANKMALSGNIAFISQSGALCTTILDWSITEKVGFSHFISIGSMIDISFGDLIDYLDGDPNTSSIIIYMESLTHARKFISAARAYSRNKPILVLKAGKSIEGAKVALSHTGALAGSAIAFEAAFRRSGVISVDTIDQLFNGAMALSKQPKPNGDKLAIVTNAGGPGILATDLLVKLGGKLAKLGKESCEKLGGISMHTNCKTNPIYIHRNAIDVDYGTATEVCLNDSDVDAVLVILTPQAHTDSELIAKKIVEISQNSNKTVLASWMGSSDVNKGIQILENGNIPTFLIPEKAIVTYMDMVKYSKNLMLLQETPANIPSQFEPKTSKNRKLIDAIISEDRFVLNEKEAKDLLKNYEIPVTKYKLAKTKNEAIELAKEIGFPIVMKIVSPDILHKTENNCIFLNINSEEEVAKTYKKLIDNANDCEENPAIHGVLIEPMINKKYELIIGAKKDPVFGPVIIFGMGGVAVEVFKDFNVGLPPLNMALAFRMIERTKIYQLLKGYRGMEGVDIPSIQFLLYKFAYLVMDFPEIKIIDINPFAIDSDSGIVLDAKIILDRKYIKGKKPDKPYSHLAISPYPSQYLFDITLKDGLKATIRPIKPEDELLEKEMFNNLSRQTQYFRFFGYIKDVTHEMLARYTQIDYEREMALMAEIEEDGVKKMIGVVRMVNDVGDESAEYAILVADPWQGKGLGSILTDLILEITKENGIKTVYATVLKANTTMVNMFKKRGFVLKSDDITTFKAVLKY